MQVGYPAAVFFALSQSGHDLARADVVALDPAVGVVRHQVTVERKELQLSEAVFQNDEAAVIFRVLADSRPIYLAGNERTDGLSRRQPDIQPQVDRPAFAARVAGALEAGGRVNCPRFQVAARQKFIRLLCAQVLHFQIEPVEVVEFPFGARQRTTHAQVDAMNTLARAGR